MSVCCGCCVLLGRGLCNGSITRPEQSYRVWCVCDGGTLQRRPRLNRAVEASGKQTDGGSRLFPPRIRNSNQYIWGL